MREVAFRRVVFARVGRGDQRIEGHVMIGQHQSFGGQKLAGAAIDNHHGVFNTRPVRIENIGNGNLQATLLKLLERQLVELIRHEHAFIRDRKSGNQADKDSSDQQQSCRAIADRDHNFRFPS